MATAVPIILCGRTTQIGGPVAQHLKPEYEVIHFIQTYEAAEAEIPMILEGRGPETPNTNDVGSRNYDNQPRAVLVGRAFTYDEVEALRQRCTSHRLPIAWMPGDPAKKPTAPPGPEYAQEIARDVKRILAEWLASKPTEDKTIIY